jgi:hypothetical protein
MYGVSGFASMKMVFGKYIAICCLTVWIIVACSGDPIANQNGGPILIEDSTLDAATSVLPTRILSPTPFIGDVATPTSGEVLSPLEIVTVDADVILVTPTLPPSKTPTQTPTITTTPTTSPTPTITVTATATFPVFPTSIIIPITAIVPNPVPQICDSTWFFIQPRPASCPLSPPISGQGVFQQFQNGFMVWVQAQDAIYVMYNDTGFPRWEVFRDFFEEGMPEDDPAFGNAPTTGLYQPRRGFGQLWRNNQAVRDRIGWAIEALEQPYSVQTQTSGDGSLFVSEPSGGVFNILPGGSGWNRYAGFGGFNQ